MTKQRINVLIKVVLLGAIVMFMANARVEAQSLATNLRVNIPFDFIVADRVLPAGQYSVGRALTQSDDVLLAIQGVDSSAHVIAMTGALVSREQKKEATLVFHRLGDLYFLSQVWGAGADYGRAIHKSHRESEAERSDGARQTPNNTADSSQTVSIIIPVR